MAEPIRVIFVCTGNSARSVMAEALLRDRGGDAFSVRSAGIEPKGINPLTVRALGEIGLDASGARSEPVRDYVGQPFDYVITVCDEAREACPVFPGGRETLHWSFRDPSAAEGTDEERLAVFRAVRAEIAARVEAFVPLAVDAHHMAAERAATAGIDR